jgi:radical SAM protein (TIGR04043 family)
MPAKAGELIAELQAHGLSLEVDGGVSPRTGGAGPSDHRAVTVFGTTVMVPFHAKGALFTARPINGTRHVRILRAGEPVALATVPEQPRFYALETADGVPYWKIAQLHAKDVLATTILQDCVRYPNRARRCQFCSIGESLKAGRTIAAKTPEQLAEVAEAAVRLDGVEHMVMTTGTPPTPDRGASVLRASAAAVSAAVPLPIQAQCEPPDDYRWFERLRAAGVTALGMHLEALDPAVRARMMPSKSEIRVAEYMRAFASAVPVFGRGQVSTYLLAGLGDSRATLLEGCRKLIDIGVYPFVVPFTPIAGTPLENRPPPTAEFMVGILRPLGQMLADAGMTSDLVTAGCAKCGACSALSNFER